MVTLATDKPKFTMDQLKLPGKKGICFTLREPGLQGSWEENIPKVKGVDAYWNYSWGLQLVEQQPNNVEFIPMTWGAYGKERMKKELAKYVVPKIKSGEVKRLLAFNEPDKKNQANMPYQKAIDYWPILESLNIPLCSPACANTEGIDDPSTQGVKGTWMRDFMQEADKRNFRVDYIGVHWYGGTDAHYFKEKLKRIYKKYGERPLLITEFAPADWHTKGNPNKNKRAEEDVLAFMKEILPWLEEQDWILGYAWFSFRQTNPAGHTSSLYDKAGNLTACGRFYKSVTNENPQGDQSIQVNK